MTNSEVTIRVHLRDTAPQTGLWTGVDERPYRLAGKFCDSWPLKGGVCCFIACIEGGAHDLLLLVNVSCCQTNHTLFPDWANHETSK